MVRLKRRQGCSHKLKPGTLARGFFLMDSPGNKKEDTSLVKIWEYLSDSNLSVLPGSCCSLAAFVKRGVTVFVVMKVADRIDDGGNRKQWALIPCRIVLCFANLWWKMLVNRSCPYQCRSSVREASKCNRNSCVKMLNEIKVDHVYNNLKEILKWKIFAFHIFWISDLRFFLNELVIFMKIVWPSSNKNEYNVAKNDMKGQLENRRLSFMRFSMLIRIMQISITKLFFYMLLMMILKQN